MAWIGRFEVQRQNWLCSKTLSRNKECFWIWYLSITDQNTHSSISDHSSSDLSTLSYSTINCPSSHSDDDNDNHNFPEDSSEPENNFDYSGHQDDSRPWDRDDLDDNNVLAAHALKDAPANPSMAHELPVNDLSTSLDWNIEDKELLPTAFWENWTVHLLYMQTLVANIFDSWTVLASNTQLSDSLDLLEATGLALEQSVKLSQQAYLQHW